MKEGQVLISGHTAQLYGVPFIVFELVYFEEVEFSLLMGHMLYSYTSNLIISVRFFSDQNLV